MVEVSTSAEFASTQAGRSLVSELRSDHGLLIGGEWRPSAGGATFAVENPADLSRLGVVSDASKSDAAEAVDAASQGLREWSDASPRERADLLLNVRDLMLRGATSLAGLISLENGKSQSDAAAEVLYAADFFRWYAEEAVRPRGDYGPAPTGRARTIVTHRPVGVAALVTPWNFPAAMPARKIAPALAAGCSVVLKPAAETPLTALALARLVEAAGAPRGVVNVVPTSDPGAVVSEWLADPRIRKLSFTGSTGVGRLLLGQAASRIVNSSMELGGNAPFMVTADANLDVAVAAAVVAKFRGGGQACTAANRFFVHASVADEFTTRFGERVEALVAGPSHGGADVGPLISDQAVRRVQGLIDDAVTRGARVTHRGNVEPGANGHFVAPQLLSDVTIESRIVREEIFGPVAPILVWDDEDHVLESINSSELALAAYVISGDLGAGLRWAEKIDAGMVAVNRGVVSDPSAPFGGMKQSGLGREGARSGLEAFQEARFFAIDWS